MIQLRAKNVSAEEIEFSVTLPTDGKYTVTFDNTCPNWSPYAQHNEYFIKATVRFCQDILVLRGVLFLNDILARLDIPPCIAGNLVGWYRKPEDPLRDIQFAYRLNEEGVFELQFVVDGIVLGKLKA